MMLRHFIRNAPSASRIRMVRPRFAPWAQDNPQLFSVQASAASSAGISSQPRPESSQDGLNLRRLPKKTIRSHLLQLLNQGSSRLSAAQDSQHPQAASNIKRILFDAKFVGDNSLNANLVNKLVAPMSAIPANILTISMQMLEAAGEFDKAIELYRGQRAQNNVNVRHLTSALRIIKQALIKATHGGDGVAGASAHTSAEDPVLNRPAPISISRADRKARDAAYKTGQVTERLQQAFDLYEDAIYTEMLHASSPMPVAGAKSSVIVANALLGAVRAVPADVLTANPDIVNQCITIMLDLNRPADEEEGEPADEAAHDLEEGAAPVPLTVEPFAGLYGQLVVIAGKAQMFSVAKSLFENMVQEAQLAPNAYTATSLLIAAGESGQLEEAVDIYENYFSHPSPSPSKEETSASDTEGGDKTVDADASVGAGAEAKQGGSNKPAVTLTAVTKFMEICLAHKQYYRGLKAFFQWRGDWAGRTALQEPNWYCLAVLARLSFHPVPHSRKDRLYKAQREGMELVTNSVMRSLHRKAFSPTLPYSPSPDISRSDVRDWMLSGHPTSYWTGTGSNSALVPLELLCGPVGAMAVGTGHMDDILLLLEKHVQGMQTQGKGTVPAHKAQATIRRFWSSLISQLAIKDQYRDLQSLTERLLMHHRDGAGGNGTGTGTGGLLCSSFTKAEVLGATVGLLATNGSHNSTQRAQSLLRMYVPVLSQEMRAEKLSAGEQPAELLNMWPLFRFVTLPRESKPWQQQQRQAQTPSDAQASKGSDPAPVNADRKLINPVAADMVPYTLSIVLQDLAANAIVTPPRGSALSASALNEALLVNALADAISHCYNAQQALECVNVFCDFVDQAQALQQPALDSQGASHASPLPLSKSSQSRIRTAVLSLPAGKKATSTQVSGGTDGAGNAQSPPHSDDHTGNADLLIKALLDRGLFC